MRATFLRALGEDDKATFIRECARRDHRLPGPAARFDVAPSTFGLVPRSPFAYWVSDRLRQRFKVLRPFESNGRVAKQGLATADDLRFVRAWWAVPAVTIAARWYLYSKGGRRSPFYGDPSVLVNWEKDGAEIKNNLNDRGGVRSNVWMLRDTAERYFQRDGLTWPLRGVRYSAQAVARGAIFSVAGKMAFAPVTELPGLLAIFNSRPFDAFIAFFAGKVGGVQYEVGLIQSVPVPDLTPADEAALAALARRAWSLKRSLDIRTETSHAFALPALLQVPGDSLAARAAAWAARVRETEDELAVIQAEIDERCFALYGISEEDRRSIIEGFGGSAAGVDGLDEEAADEAGADDEEETEADTADTATLAAELVSWAVGVAFGRFDVRLATGARELPGEPEPFDPLPVCSPGMLTGADGLPFSAPPPGYPLAFPADGVLVDDPGHPLDLTTAVRAVFDTVFGSRADAAWQEAGDLLDPKGHDLSSWLRSGFFEHHLRRHSKSRRKAPIVWQLGTGRSGIFAYTHRLTRDSLFAIGNDIAAPRLATEERRLASLRTGVGASPSARDRAEIDAAEAAVEEAATVLAEVRRVAPLWDPDLDDGIVLVSAPLWRLVPHKAWQKELKGRWDELAAGKYDWAHLAMHLWPERVVPKCAPDRSLAIAHGLEDVFWAEGSDGKWAKRSRPTRPVEDLVAERTSPAVKAALAALQTAPALAGSGRGRGRS